MKKIILPIFAFLGSLILADTLDIDSQIANIKKASTAQERVKLVNNFKITLANMSANDRANAINKLRESMHTKNTIKITLSKRIQIDKIQNHISQQMIQQKNLLNKNMMNINSIKKDSFRYNNANQHFLKQ